ncbi:MAG: recombinase family protein, partial [Clostridia bacterium]|nr:recombinase family protein [Clostridia bacterium]
MNAVIYARYSSDSQREESIEGQIRECTEFAEKNDMVVIEHYIDRAFSAKTDDRPDFQRMIKDSEKHKYEVVIVWKLDRFARNRYDSANNKRILRKNGVKVVSATEQIAEGSVGILMESILEGYAEFYSAELSEKIRRGQTENALKGKTNGGGVPFGYVLDSEQRLAINPATAPIVLEIFQRYANGETKKEIAADLTGRGIKTKTGNDFVP